MPLVKMPDGHVVNLPDNLDPETAAQLGRFGDAQKRALAAGFKANTPEFDSIVRAGTVAHTPTNLDTSPVGRAIAPALQTAMDIPGIIGRYAGDKVFDATGSPLAATATRMIPDTVLALEGGGLRALKGVFGAGGGLAEGAAGAAAPGELSPTSVVNSGFHLPQEHPLAASIAGASGRDALNEHAQTIANIHAQNASGVNTAFSPSDLERAAQFQAAREAPNAVYNRWAGSLPSNMRLEDQDLNLLRGVGRDGRITTGSPAVQAQLDQLRAQLASPEHLGGSFNGDQLLNEIKALRQESRAGMNMEDVDQQALARAKGQIADQLEDFGTRHLPDNANVSSDQLIAARKALAQNHAVEDSMYGANVDMAKIGRVQRNNPGMLTEGLAAIGDFANNHPALAGLAQRTYIAPSIATDVAGQSAYQAGRNTESAMTIPNAILGGLGLRSVARRFLTGGGWLTPADSTMGVEGLPTGGYARAAAVSPPRDDSLFAELMHTPPPTTGPVKPPALPAPAAVPTGSGPVATEGQLADIGLTPDVRAAQQAHPGLADPNPPVPPAPREMPVTEFSPPQNWGGPNAVLQPNGAPGQGNLFDDFINFRDGPGAAGGLRFAPSSPGGPGDLGSVMSQGVPEDIVQRGVMPTVHWPLDQELDLVPGQTPRQFAAPHAGPATEGPEGTLADHFVTAPNQPPQQTVYRGVPPGVDPTAPRNGAGALFYAPDKAEAEGYGSIVHEAVPTDVHDAGGIHDFLGNNGVDPTRAGQPGALLEAASNYRAKPGAKQWVKFTYPIEGSPAEYIHLPSLPDDGPSLGNALTGPQQ